MEEGDETFEESVKLDKRCFTCGVPFCCLKNSISANMIAISKRRSGVNKHDIPRKLNHILRINIQDDPDILENGVICRPCFNKLSKFEDVLNEMENFRLHFESLPTFQPNTSFLKESSPNITFHTKQSGPYSPSKQDHNSDSSTLKPVYIENGQSNYVKFNGNANMSINEASRSPIVIMSEKENTGSSNVRQPEKSGYVNMNINNNSNVEHVNNMPSSPEGAVCHVRDHSPDGSELSSTDGTLRKATDNSSPSVNVMGTTRTIVTSQEVPSNHRKEPDNPISPNNNLYDNITNISIKMEPITPEEECNFPVFPGTTPPKPDCRLSAVKTPSTAQPEPSQQRPPGLLQPSPNGMRIPTKVVPYSSESEFIKSEVTDFRDSDMNQPNAAFLDFAMNSVNSTGRTNINLPTVLPPRSYYVPANNQPIFPNVMTSPANYNLPMVRPTLPVGRQDPSLQIPDVNYLLRAQNQQPVNVGMVYSHPVLLTQSGLPSTQSGSATVTKTKTPQEHAEWVVQAAMHRAIHGAEMATGDSKKDKIAQSPDQFRPPPDKMPANRPLTLTFESWKGVREPESSDDNMQQTIVRSADESEDIVMTSPIEYDQRLIIDEREDQQLLESPNKSSSAQLQSGGSPVKPKRKQTVMTAIRPMERRPMKEWLREQIEIGDILGLKWIDNDVFQIPWKHAARSEWQIGSDALLFERYAILTGIYKPGEPDQSKNHRRWKQNFRCAINSLADFKEVTEEYGMKKSGLNAFKVYKILTAQEARQRKQSKLEKNKKQYSQINLPDVTSVNGQNVSGTACTAYG